jgi:hypothetical protein
MTQVKVSISILIMMLCITSSHELYNPGLDSASNGFSHAIRRGEQWQGY